MAIVALKQNIEQDEPDEDVTDGGDQLARGYCCEECGSEEFALTTWRDMPVVCCATCHTPQEAVFWAMTGEKSA